ncbi:transcriptional regulator [Reichenbachiella sp. 5M10]|uniref:winged helix-turn-helix domain-containing protein n=1 Tax=Reichenbachiella sp. 5M10 TaxID=1889772 RepID=UPI000C15B2D1|nr:transcriptional regulator [Reichenbachiella sp. 5M10]PIB35271.1 transcriptional regulator [Reichenbachiella sp. 5M10]
MKDILQDLNKAFENKVRLGIMSALVVNDTLDFNSLKDLLGVTDGNLASHIKSLTKSSYVHTEKQFVNNKPHTQYSATELGRAAFIKHIKAIEQLLRN